MNPLDDHELIDLLQTGIAERQSRISAPDGIGDDARHAARKRTATRAVSAGVPVLAAAGVATVLASGSGAGSTAARSPSAGGADASSGPTATAPGGPVTAQDTAYILKRVKANVAQAGQDGTAVHASGYARGTVSSDGSLVNLGSKLGDVYDYTAPDGSEYSREVLYQTDGSRYVTMTDHFSPKANGTVNDTQTIINPRNHTYSRTRYPAISAPHAGWTMPDLYSSPSEVQHALQSGRVTQKGTATIDGTQAITLSITGPNVHKNSLTLYVDAHTYQPLRTVIAYSGLSDLEVSDWVPATADDIAQAKDDSIPSGYTKVDKAAALRLAASGVR